MSPDSSVNQWGRHHVGDARPSNTWSSTQKTVALSSGGAELVAMVKTSTAADVTERSTILLMET